MRLNRIFAATAGCLLLCSAAHAAPPRLVEAWAEAPVDLRAPMRIAPGNPAQAQDPVYAAIANQLGEILTERGFNMVEKGGEAKVVLLVDYVAYTKPIGSYYDGALADPVYRALVVTALDARSVHGPNDPPRVLWQTVIDSGGFSADVTQTIPALVNYGARYYGQALTPRGLGSARWCAAGDLILGSHIKPTCSANPGAPPPPHASPSFRLGSNRAGLKQTKNML